VVDHDRPGLWRPQAHHGLDQLGLPVALHPRDAEHLAGADHQVDAVNGAYAAIVVDGQPGDLEYGSARLGGGLLDLQAHRAADHERGQLLLGRVRRRDADRAAAPDHRDPVRDGLDLFELVGNEDDRLASLGEPAHDREQLLGLLRGEHGGRLIEDEQVDVPGEGLDDLDPLLRADGQVLHQLVRVDWKAVPLRDLDDLAP
jgi:hypothetical protein